MLEYILLGVALAVFLVSWYTPIPYGRFSDSPGLSQINGLPDIPNRWFIGLANIPAIIFLCIHIPDVSNFGLVVFVFILVHFVFRALILNVYYDIWVNWMRCHGDAKVKDMYVTYKGLENEFQLLFWLNITSPNYFFEIIEWGFIVLLTWHTESLCYFIATWLILWVRALSINRWLEIEYGKTPISEEQ